MCTDLGGSRGRSEGGSRGRSEGGGHRRLIGHGDTQNGDQNLSAEVDIFQRQHVAAALPHIVGVAPTELAFGTVAPALYAQIDSAPE